jgi:hypothetical protein
VIEAGKFRRRATARAKPKSARTATAAAKPATTIFSRLFELRLAAHQHCVANALLASHVSTTSLAIPIPERILPFISLKK